MECGRSRATPIAECAVKKEIHLMSSLDFTRQHIDEVMDRSVKAVPIIDPKKTVLLVLDVQRMCVTPGGAAYIPSVGGAPEGKDVVEPINRVIDACRKAGTGVVWSLWGLRGDGWDAGMAAAKWPGLNCGTPSSPGSWDNPKGDDQLDPAMKPVAGEPIIKKHRFSSFYNTPLDEFMREKGADTLVIAGVTSANCVHATAIDGWNKNYKIVALADTTCAIPSGTEQPNGYGQHWEALRNIQMNYGDVLLVSEFLEKIK